MPFEIHFIADQNHTVSGHVIAIRQIEQRLFRLFEASFIHHRVHDHVYVRIVSRAKSLHLGRNETEEIEENSFCRGKRTRLISGAAADEKSSAFLFSDQSVNYVARIMKHAISGVEILHLSNAQKKRIYFSVGRVFLKAFFCAIGHTRFIILHLTAVFALSYYHMCARARARAEVSPTIHLDKSEQIIHFAFSSAALAY